MSNGRPWTTQEVKYMRQNYGFIPAVEIAEHLGRTVESVRMYAYKQLKIRSARPHRQHQHVAEIKKMIYDLWHPTEIANALGTSTKSIYNRVRDGLQYDELDYAMLKSNARRAKKKISPILKAGADS